MRYENGTVWIQGSSPYSETGWPLWAVIIVVWSLAMFVAPFWMFNMKAETFEKVRRYALTSWAIVVVALGVYGMSQ